MKFLITSIAIAVAFVPIAAASQVGNPDTPVGAAVSQPSDERLALARQFIAVGSPKDEVMASTRAVAWRMASAGIENEGQRASAKAAFDGLFVRLAPRIYGALPSLLETYAQVYAREFSSEDLRQMIAFGQTSAGKHFLLKYALLDTDPAVLEAQTDLLGRLSPIIQEYQKEMCGKRAAARIAAGDTKAKCPLAAG